MAAVAVVALLDIAEPVALAETMGLAVAPQGLVALAEAEVAAVVAHTSQTTMAPALACLLVAVAAVESGFLALDQMALAELAQQELVGLADLGEEVDRQAAAGHRLLETLVRVVPMEEVRVGQDLEKILIHSAPLPTALSALSVLSGVMAVAIRQTPQTSN